MSGSAIKHVKGLLFKELRGPGGMGIGVEGGCTPKTTLALFFFSTVKVRSMPELKNNT